MLQITILHEEGKIKVAEIKDHANLSILAEFDEVEGRINLEPLLYHVGEKVLVSHFNKVDDGVVFEYEHPVTLTKVDKDENGIWFFQYN